MIVCPDCGGRAHLIQLPGPEERLEVDDVVAYRCEDCLDRWDVVVGDEDVPDDDTPRVL